MWTQAEMWDNVHKLSSGLHRIIFCYHRAVPQEPGRMYLLQVFYAAENSSVWAISLLLLEPTKFATL